MDSINKVLAMSATSLLMAAQAAHGAGGENAAATDGQDKPAFTDIDANSDQSIEWNELQQEFDQVLSGVGWQGDQVMTAFDLDNDNALDPNEYEAFTAALDELSQDRTAATGQPDRQGQETTGASAEVAQQGAQDQQGVQNQEGQAAGAIDQEQAAGAELSPAEQDEDRVAGQQQDQQVGNEEPIGANQGAAVGRDPSVAAGGSQQEQVTEIESFISFPAGEQLSVDEITDMQVMNSQGEKVGDVSAVVRSELGDETSLVVSTEGSTGNSGKDIVVKVEEFSLSSDNSLILEGATEEQLQDRPEYSEEDFVSVR